MAVARASLVLACLALARALDGQQQGALRATHRVNATVLHKTAEARRTTKRRSACECINWASVYYDHLADCGRAAELYFLSKFGFSAAYAATEPISGLPHRVCNDFLKNFKNASCGMVDQYPFPADSMTNKQWCYVANDCDTLNGGDYATNTMGFQLGGWNNLASTSNLSWKVCDQTTDAGSMLMNKSPGELLEMCLRDDISCSRIFRFGYPVVEVTWGEAQYLLEGVDAAYTPGADLTTIVDGLTAPTAPFTRLMEVHSTIGGIVKSGQGTILDSPGHGDNFHVIYGREVWEVKRIELGDMAYLGGHFSLEFAVTCVMGCAPTRLGNPEDPDHPDLDLETM